MFKPVTGSAKDAFDEETQALFSKRTNDDRLSAALAQMKRPQRNHLPVLISDSASNPHLQKEQQQMDRFPYYMFGMCTFFGRLVLDNNLVLASNQFMKGYYPYGIIARRSMVVSPATKASWFVPMVAFFGYAAWCHKEYPRTQRPDYSDPSEE